MSRGSTSLEITSGIRQLDILRKKRRKHNRRCALSSTFTIMSLSAFSLLLLNCYFSDYHCDNPLVLFTLATPSFVLICALVYLFAVRL